MIPGPAVSIKCDYLANLSPTAQIPRFSLKQRGNVCLCACLLHKLCSQDNFFSFLSDLDLPLRTSLQPSSPLISETPSSALGGAARNVFTAPKTRSEQDVRIPTD